MRKLWGLAVLFLPSGAALAHTGHAGGGFASGLLHPLLGADHLLAMLAVGVWAARYSGAARWLAPVAFVTCMALGGVVPVPYIEPGIALSLLVFGLALASAVRVDAWVGALPAAGFALWHGNAHFAEAPQGAGLVAFVCGMLLATATLHLAGMFLASRLARWSAWLPRAFGAATALAGAWFLVV